MSEERPLCFAEIVSELLYAGKTLEEVAGYDCTQMFRVVFRKRDKYGKLVRILDDDLPQWVKDSTDENGMRRVKKPVALGSLYRKIRKHQGMTEEQVRRRWDAYKEANPEMGKGGVRGKRVRRSDFNVEKD